MEECLWSGALVVLVRSADLIPFHINDNTVLGFNIVCTTTTTCISITTPNSFVVVVLSLFHFVYGELQRFLCFRWIHSCDKNEGIFDLVIWDTVKKFNWIISTSLRLEAFYSELWLRALRAKKLKFCFWRQENLPTPPMTYHFISCASDKFEKNWGTQWRKVSNKTDLM